MSERWKVVIVGGGFGGLSAAQHLNSDLVDVTLIDRRNYHPFQPLLYQVATGSLSPGEIASPLLSVLSRQKTLAFGSEPLWISIAIRNRSFWPMGPATGSQTSYFGHNEWQEWAPGLKSIEEATTVRHKILYAFEVAERIPDPKQRRAWLTFVIVGAGPTGVELSGAIAEIARQTLKNDFRSINPEEAQVILLDGAPRVLMSFPEDLAEKATRSRAKLGVQVRCGAMVKRVDEGGLTIESDNRTDSIAAKTVVWAGGITASPLGKILASHTKAETDKGGRLKVKPDLTIPNYADIYVIGDLASVTDHNGKPLPGLAQVAMQGGAYAAKAILRKVKGQSELPPFHYFDKGSLAVIGRAAAVADVFGTHLSGFIAWLVWVFIHLTYLVTFQSRVLVSIQWAIQNLTFSRGARLIAGGAPTDFNFSKKLSEIKPYTFLVMAILILVMGGVAIFRTPADIFPNRVDTIADFDAANGSGSRRKAARMPQPQPWSPSWPTSSHEVSWKCRSPESSPSTMCETRTESSNCATPAASWRCDRERREASLGCTNGSIAFGFALDRAALHREFPDVAFQDFESWTKTQDWNALLPSV